MKLNKVVKKIAALGAGAAMLGATLLGAAAADLNEYPAPFVQDGAFNGVVVVGDQAATEDVVGAIEIGMALQYAMKETEMTGCGTTEITISDGVKIQGTGSEILNYGEYLDDVRTTPLDIDDLPVILAEGDYYDNQGDNDNEVSYNQYLTIETNGLVGFGQPDNDLDADTYMIVDKDLLYVYELEFDESVEFDDVSDTNDLENTKLEIQGNQYTITDVSYGAELIDEMTLMAGDTVIWLQQDQPITKVIDGTEHEVMVVDVTELEDSCGVSIDGTTAWIDVGSTATINGVEIGVTDAKAIHAQLQDVDVCELNVGASEIVLKEGNEVEVNGMDIDGSEVTFTQSETGNEVDDWDGFTIEYIPGDEEYKIQDEYFVDPVLGNFMFLMGGEVTEREEYTFDNGGFTFINNEGKDVELPIYHNEDDGITYWGEDDDEYMLIESDVLALNGITGVSDPTDVTSYEGTTLLAVTSGFSAHILEIRDIDTGDNIITLYDRTYERTFEDGFDEELTTIQTISLGSLGDIQLTLAQDGDDNYTLTATDLGEAATSIETNYGATLAIYSTVSEIADVTDAAASDGETIVRLTEEEADDAQITEAVMDIDVVYDEGSDDALEIYLDTVSGDYYDEDFEKTVDSDIKMTSTEHGTWAEYDDDNNDYVTIYYPEEEVEVNVFVAPVSAEIAAEGGNIETTQINKINVGAAKLASEVTVGSKNMILVGGPCANDATAEAMGVACADAGEHFEEGKAMIKLYDVEGNTAMVVAGYSAMDTRMATTVLADYSNPEYALEGDEVVVTGTSLSDISVGVPQ